MYTDNFTTVQNFPDGSKTYLKAVFQNLSNNLCAFLFKSSVLLALLYILMFWVLYSVLEVKFSLKAKPGKPGGTN